MSVDVPIGTTSVSLAQLDERSREIFRRIVESYLTTGDPVGSRNVSRILQTALSPASVRNVMADLEALGLVYAPHTSAGRLPTEFGLRFYVDALLEFGDLSGREVGVYTSIVAPEDQPQIDSYKLFTTCTGADVKYEGSKEFEAQLPVQVVNSL